MKKKVTLFIVLVLVILSAIFFKSPIISIEIPNEKLKADIADIINKKHWLITSESTYQQIAESHPLVEKAIVKKTLIKGLLIQIELKKPMAAVKSGAIYIMIDHQGIVLEISSEKKADYVIDGFNVSATEVGSPIITDNEKLIVKAVQLVDLYERFTDIEPNVHLIDGDLIQKINPRFWVNFGTGHDIRSQFNDAMTIYDDMLLKNSTTGIINLSVPGQTVIQTWKN